jgi:hypothetical protein
MEVGHRSGVWWHLSDRVSGVQTENVAVPSKVPGRSVALVLNPPANLHEADIIDVLASNWGIAPREIGYHAVGFGSHHWITDDHFLSVDRGSGAPDLVAALRTATALMDIADLDFVIAPIPTDTNAPIAPVGEDWVMHVYPRLEIVDSTLFGPHADTHVVELVRAIHDATPVASQHAGREDFSIGHRHDLEEALEDLARPWDRGPYADRARLLLADHADDVRRLLDVHDRMVNAVPRNNWVITHGEPHRGNIFRTTQGWAVVDWDTALVAPSERDLWDLPTGCDSQLRELYRLRWDLTEIAVYISRFHSEHTGDENDDQSWEALVSYIATRSPWPHLM